MVTSSAAPALSMRPEKYDEGEVEGEQVINCRGGAVLRKKTILKSDHFPGYLNKRLFHQIDGAPNYRLAGSLHVHCVAIPTIDGIRNVLNHIGVHQSGMLKTGSWAGFPVFIAEFDNCCFWYL